MQPCLGHHRQSHVSLSKGSEQEDQFHGHTTQPLKVKDGKRWRNFRLTRYVPRDQVGTQISPFKGGQVTHLDSVLFQGPRVSRLRESRATGERAVRGAGAHSIKGNPGED